MLPGRAFLFRKRLCLPFRRLSLALFIQRALYVVSVKKVVSLFRIRLAQILGVYLLNVGVLVGNPDFALGVVRVEACGALCADFVVRSVGLSAAGYASAAAGHHFDEVIEGFPSLCLGRAHRVDDGRDVSELMDDRDAEILALHVDGRFLHVLQSASRNEVDVAEFAAGDHCVCRAESRFHDASGRSEDRSRSGVRSEGIIGFAFREGIEVDSRLLDETGEFPGRQDGIDILETGRVHRLVPLAFVFFCRAGHDGYGENFRRIQLRLLRPVGFDHRAHHLLGALRRGDVGEQVVAVLLRVIDPGGAAGGEERNFALSFKKPADEFGSLFHDGEVSGEVGVEYVVESDLTERGVDLLGGKSAGLESEFFAERYADRGSDLYDGGDFRIGEAIPDLPASVRFIDGADGAVGRALAAANAGRIGEVGECRRSDDGLSAASLVLDRVDALHLLAHFDAAAAVDALVAVEHDRVVGVVDRPIDDEVVEADLAQAEFSREALQFAIVVACAGEAFLGMVGKDEFKHSPSRLDDFRIVGDDAHSLGDLGAARAEHARRSFLAHDADAAGRPCREIGIVAERGDLYVGLFSGGEDGCSLRHLQGFSVYFDVNHYASP